MAKTKPTPRQRKAAKAVVLNAISDKPISNGAILKSVGYGFGFSNSPHRVLQSEGFQDALKESGLLGALKKQGINPARIAKKIDVLLDAKRKTIRDGTEFEEDDYQAIDKGIKHATSIYGIVDDKDRAGVKNTYNFIFSPEVQDRVRVINDDIKNLLTNPGDVQKNQDDN